jgi:hypothetical protein
MPSSPAKQLEIGLESKERTGDNRGNREKTKASYAASLFSLFSPVLLH